MRAIIRGDVVAESFFKLSNMNWSMVHNSKQESRCGCVYLNISSPGIIIKENLSIDKFLNKKNIKKNQLKICRIFCPKMLANPYVISDYLHQYS